VQTGAALARGAAGHRQRPARRRSRPRLRGGARVRSPGARSTRRSSRRRSTARCFSPPRDAASRRAPPAASAEASYGDEA
jgi:hypothetical protein